MRRATLTLLIMSPHWVWTCSIALCATLLMTFGFTAVYSRLYRTSGPAGFAGFVFLVLAFVLQTTGITWEVFLYPVIVNHEPSIALFRDGILRRSTLLHVFSTVFYVSMAIGTVLFSPAIVRSREFPAYAGILFFAGVALYAVGSSLNQFVAVAGVIVLSAGCIGLGSRMVSSQNDE